MSVGDHHGFYAVVEATFGALSVRHHPAGVTRLFLTPSAAGRRREACWLIALNRIYKPILRQQIPGRSSISSCPRKG